VNDEAAAESGVRICDT